MATYQPKPEHKFTFGLWTVGNPGRDPFGEPTRAKISPVEIVKLLAEVGSAGVLRLVALACAEFYQKHPETVEIMIHERAEFRDSVPTHLMFRSETRNGIDAIIKAAIAANEFRNVHVQQATNGGGDVRGGFKSLERHRPASLELAQRGPQVLAQLAAARGEIRLPVGRQIQIGTQVRIRLPECELTPGREAAQQFDLRIVLQLLVAVSCQLRGNTVSIPIKTKNTRLIQRLTRLKYMYCDFRFCGSRFRICWRLDSPH